MMAALLALGCADTSSAQGSGGGPIVLEEFAPAYAAATCDNIGPCCRRDGTPYDRTTCYENAKSLILATIAKQAGPNVTYDASAARDCVNAHGAALRTCARSTTNATNDPCLHVFTGMLPAGAPCKSDAECTIPPASHVTCIRDPGTSGGGAGGSATGGEVGSTTSTGICVVTKDYTRPARGKVGVPCAGDCLGSNLDAACNPMSVMGAVTDPSVTALCHRPDRLYCSPESLKCTPHVDVGSPCSTYACAPGARCDSGTCVAQRDTGPCVSSPDACLDSAFCDVAADRCTPKLADGQPCSGGDASCQSGYCEARGAVTGSAVGAGASGPSTSSSLCTIRKFTNPGMCDGTDTD
jgi:hypothetical protein